MQRHSGEDMTCPEAERRAVWLQHRQRRGCRSRWGAVGPSVPSRPSEGNRKSLKDLIRGKGG